MNRETWLLTAITELNTELFSANGYQVPKVKVSVGMPIGGKRFKRIGEYWAPKASADDIGTVFISPVLDDSLEVLGVLVHELVHAVVGVENGHNNVFKRCAIAVGLTGKMRSTKAGDELKLWLKTEVIGIIGEYPHSKLNPSFGTKKQSTRLIKQSCEPCGYIVRSSRKCIDEFGYVICPGCGEVMV